MRGVRLLGPLFLLAATAASGCGTKQPTAIVLALQADVALPEEVDAVEINVSRQGGSNTVFFRSYDVSRTTEGARVRLPGTLTFQRSDSFDLDEPITFEITARLGGKERLLRRSTLTFQEEKTKLLRMPLAYSCYDFPSCGPGQSCKGGACIADPEPVEKLPEFDETVRETFSAEDRCFKSIGDAGCFKDAVTVFDFSGVTPDCEVEVPNVGQGKLNVSLQWDKATSRYRFSPNAYEPEKAPEELTSGWQFAKGSTTRIKLGSTLCATLQGKGKQGAAKPLALRYASDCAPNLEAPPCIEDVEKPGRLEDSLCYQCIARPAPCGAYAQKARQSAAKGFLDCIGDRPFQGQFQKGACIADARAACKGQIDASCAADLASGACAAKYGELQSFTACVDDQNGGLGDTVAADLAAAYARCKAVCDLEGFDKACVAP